MTGTRARRVAPAPDSRGNGACRIAPRYAPTQAAQGEDERPLPDRSGLDLHGDVATTAALLVGRRDPASMTPEGRLAELGEILAGAFRRQHQSRGPKDLDVCPQPEPACEPGTVNSPETTEDSHDS